MASYADVAMYRAKARGESTYAQYDAVSDFHSHTRLREESDLRAALARNEIQSFYQPIVDTHTERAIGVEVLARWPDDEGRIRSPQWFIALAEESDLICELDHYMLRQATQQTACLSEHGLEVAVNVAPKTLLQPRFPDLVEEMIHACDTGSRASLCIELTERTLANPNLIAQILERLDRAGVHVAVDDFGTGYSSLAYLSRYPLHHLKIDKTFVAGIGKDQRKEAIVTTIIELAHNLGLKTVAEGVESEAQRRFLEARQCDALQGFLLARPMPIDILSEWLRDRSG